MAKSPKSSKTSGFDVEKFIARMEEKSRKEKEERQKREALLQEYSIPWNMKDKEPPLPGMKLNAWQSRWEPENIGDFIREYGDDLKKLKKAILNNLDTNQGSATSEPSKSETSSSSAISVSVSQEHQCTSATDTPQSGDQSSKPSESSAKASEPISEVTPQDTSKKSAFDQLPESTIRSEITVPVEQSKKTRISAKMIDVEFDDLSRDYLQVVSLGEKKPVFLPLELRDALDAIARLGDDRRLSASHIAINVIRAFLNEHRDLINRKLAGVKLSI